MSSSSLPTFGGQALFAYVERSDLDTAHKRTAIKTDLLGAYYFAIGETPPVQFGHSENGMTRVNVDKVNGGTASNIIAEHVDAVAEARGETTALMEYAKSELIRQFETAAEMHGCNADVTVENESPRADSDPELADVVANIAEDLSDVDTVLSSADFGASEDATFLMNRVQSQGGLATYLIVGTDHPTSHHTSTFDIDERSLETGVKMLTQSILSVAKNGP